MGSSSRVASPHLLDTLWLLHALTQPKLQQHVPLPARHCFMRLTSTFRAENPSIIPLGSRPGPEHPAAIIHQFDFPGEARPLQQRALSPGRAACPPHSSYSCPPAAALPARWLPPPLTHRAHTLSPFRALGPKHCPTLPGLGAVLPLSPPALPRRGDGTGLPSKRRTSVLCKESGFQD